MAYTVCELPGGSERYRNKSVVNEESDACCNGDWQWISCNSLLSVQLFQHNKC